MAPLPIFSESPNPGPLLSGAGYNFPPTPGMPVPRRPPSSSGAPDVDDVFVVIVSLAVVASLTIFVLLQAISVLKEVLDTRSTPFCAIPIATFRKHGLLSLNSASSEQQPLLEPSSSFIVGENGYQYSRWIGPHRCRFTLSPERYASDTSSTLTRSSSSDSTVVGGRICVVYDDTVTPSEEEEEEGGDEDDDDGEEGEEATEDDEDSQSVPLRTRDYEPRSRVRRQALFVQ